MPAQHQHAAADVFEHVDQGVARRRRTFGEAALALRYADRAQQVAALRRQVGGDAVEVVDGGVAEHIGEQAGAGRVQRAERTEIEGRGRAPDRTQRLDLAHQFGVVGKGPVAADAQHGGGGGSVQLELSGVGVVRHALSLAELPDGSIPAFVGRT
ncbi:hypothetical protein D9M71_118040 [compost metagenome]